MRDGRRWLGPLLGALCACEGASRDVPRLPERMGSTGLDAGPLDASACAGLACAEPAPLFDPNDPFRQRIVLRGDTSEARPSRAASACAGLGPELEYELNLEGFSEPVTVYAGLRASFDGSLRVERGPAEDPFLVACNEDHAAGVTDAFLAIAVPPERYHVVVDGQQASDSGPFELVLELPPSDAACFRGPPNDGCADALPIDPSRAVQTFVGTTECATDQADPAWECGDFAYRGGEVFYAIDVSERTNPVLLHATTDLEPKGADTVLFLVRAAGSECVEPLACNDDAALDVTSSELWARLDPGRYLLAVEGYEGQAVDFGLKVELGSEPCVASNDTCQTAQDIEAVPGRQQLTVWPMCGDDTIISNCQAVTPSPDIFFRLDLSAFGERVRVRASAQRDTRSFEGLVLMADGAGTCGPELWCGDFDLWLEPAAYYLALDGFRAQHGPVRLEIEIETAGAPALVSCIDEAVALCAAELDCCSGEGQECWLVYSSCGLAREALDCLCTAEPACCDGAGSSSDCGTLLQACGTFCPGFDPVLSCADG